MGDDVRKLIVKNAEDLVKLGIKYDTEAKAYAEKNKARKPGYLDDDVMDCSEFVYQVYTKAGVSGVPALNSHAIAASSDFEAVETPKEGDIVYWKQGHVAIVVDPETGEFIGSQTSTGVARSNYLQNIYWSARPGRKFFRYKNL